MTVVKAHALGNDFLLIENRDVPAGADRAVLGRYFIGVGTFRFLLEFVRVNTRVVGPLTVAQLFAVAVVVFGVSLLPVGRRAVKSAA